MLSLIKFYFIKKTALKAAWHLDLPFYSPPYSVLNLTASIDWAPFQRGCVFFCQINYKHSSLTSNCGNRWLPFCSRCNFGWIRGAVCQLILASALLDSPVNCACSLLCASRCWRKGLVEGREDWLTRRMQVFANWCSPCTFFVACLRL